VSLFINSPLIQAAAFVITLAAEIAGRRALSFIGAAASHSALAIRGRAGIVFLISFLKLPEETRSTLIFKSPRRFSQFIIILKGLLS
jgi:hypothetical protein